MTTFFTKMLACYLLTPILLIDANVHEIPVDRGFEMSKIFSPVKKRFSQEKQVYLGEVEKNQKKFDISPDTLLADEKQIYDQLGPIYQKIYLFAFDNEQRQRIVVYVDRGLDPFDAMNIVLRVEERRYKRALPPQRSLTPAERSAVKKIPRKEIMGLQ